MIRRAVGWLLLLGSPGLVAGVTLTLFYALSRIPSRIPWPILDLIFFALWGVTSVASAVGGSLAPRDSASGEARLLMGTVGSVFGAVAFYAVVATADYLAPDL